VVAQQSKYLLLGQALTQHPLIAKPYGFAWLVVAVVADKIQALEVQMVLVEQLHLVRHF
jgi:hypothetical protein